jgi:hypothetical protein
MRPSDELGPRRRRRSVRMQKAASSSRHSMENIHAWRIQSVARHRFQTGSKLTCPMCVYKLRTAPDRFPVRLHRRNCPYDCPCEPPQQGLQSQREPNRLIGEVTETEGFTKRIDDVRDPGFRLANRRLRPLGHLTAHLQVYVTKTLTRNRSTARR